MLAAWVAAGLAAGLLVNYLADVLPLTRRLSRPRWESLGQYLFSSRKFVVQIFYLLAFIFISENPPLGFAAWMFATVLVYFGVVAVIDLEHRLVMHPVSVVGLLAMAAIGVVRHGWVLTLIGGIGGFTVMLALYFLGDLLGRGLARLRKEQWEEVALGFGDVNLAAVIGLLMGWPGVIAALILGVAIAGVFSLIFIFVSFVRGKYKLFAAIPYAPFMCIGAVVLIAISIYQT
jgi:leader peptidase (prepilin peptidase)/N-methyltransferase